ncbi:hypothetical protein JCM8097_002410 [Rhodosporidiobolus ruineniae]
MRAWVFRTKGEPSAVLKLEQDYPKPTPGKGRILVKVHAASLNPVGWKAMGMPPVSWLQKVPAVPESDFSGVVEGGDLAGSGLSVGDEVFGLVPAEKTMKTGGGVLAEYTLTDPKLTVKKPANVSFEEASSFPLTTFTAYSTLKNLGGMKKGGAQRVFINGGSGGVGVYAVQLAKAYGAYVVTTCSPPSRSLVETLGADEILDYKASPLSDQLSAKYAAKSGKPFDLVLDTVGHDLELYRRSPEFLAPEGIFLDIAGPPLEAGLFSAGIELVNRTLRPSWLGGTPRKYHFGMMKPTKADLDEMAQFVEEGKLKPVIDEVFPFEEALRAYDRQKSGRSKGKVVVSVVG